LKEKVHPLKAQLNKVSEKILNKKHFLQLVKKHTEIGAIE